MIPGRVARGLVAGASGLLAAFILTAAGAMAADPSASPVSGDVRTSASAPGLVGDPLFALLGVLLIGLVATAATLLYIRLTSRG